MGGQQGTAYLLPPGLLLQQKNYPAGDMKPYYKCIQKVVKTTITVTPSYYIS